MRLDLLDLADVHAGDAHRASSTAMLPRSRTSPAARTVVPRVLVDERRVDGPGPRITRRDRAAPRTGSSPLPATSSARPWLTSAPAVIGVPWLPGTLPIDVWPTHERARCPPRTRAVWPGAAVFGYGFACRWLSVVGPLAGPLDGPPSVFGPCGVAMMMKRCQVPFSSPSDSRLAMLRNQSVT